MVTHVGWTPIPRGHRPPDSWTPTVVCGSFEANSSGQTGPPSLCGSMSRFLACEGRLAGWDSQRWWIWTPPGIAHAFCIRNSEGAGWAGGLLWVDCCEVFVLILAMEARVGCLVAPARPVYFQSAWFLLHFPPWLTDLALVLALVPCSS